MNKSLILNMLQSTTIHTSKGVIPISSMFTNEQINSIVQQFHEKINSDISKISNDSINQESKKKAKGQLNG